MSFKISNIKEIKKLSSSDLQVYKNQKNVKRQYEYIGGYEKIVFATDQDLD